MSDTKLSKEITASPTQLMRLIENSVKIKRPLMIWGQPGIGKSDCVREVGKKLNRKVIDIRLLLMTETDLRGIPFKVTDEATGKEVVSWSVPEFLPMAERDEWLKNNNMQIESNAILFLDELTAAPPSVQKAALQLVLDRQIGEYKLPDDVAVIAGGNRQEDRTNASAMPSALANRFTHVTVEANVECWKEWGIKNGINPFVLAFVEQNPNCLNTFNARENYRTFATPRSWKYVSDFMNSAVDENFNPTINPADLSILIQGSVGAEVSQQFRAYMSVADRIPKITDILRGNHRPVIEKMEKTRSGSDSSIEFLLVVSLLSSVMSWQTKIGNTIGKGENAVEFTAKTWEEMVINSIEFVMGIDNYEGKNFISEDLRAIFARQLLIYDQNNNIGLAKILSSTKNNTIFKRMMSSVKDTVIGGMS